MTQVCLEHIIDSIMHQRYYKASRSYMYKFTIHIGNEYILYTCITMLSTVQVEMEMTPTIQKLKMAVSSMPAMEHGVGR